MSPTPTKAQFRMRQVFFAGEHGQIAVKVIDQHGNKLLVVKKLEEI
jgi:hypothetical protein